MNDQILGAGRYTFRAFDRFGNAVPLWCENRVGRWLRRTLRLSARWHKCLYVPHVLGQWGMECIEPNLLVTAGKALVASRINGAGSEAAVTFLEVGTGTTAADAADTLLETPILAATDAAFNRQAATVSRETTTTTNDTARLDTTFGPAGTTHAVTECGAFNNTTENTVDMLARSVFTVKNIDSGGSLQVIYDFPVS